jgi:hypothetical protein
MRLCFGSKDVQDQFGSIDDFDVESAFKVTRLCRVQIVVKEDDVCLLHFDQAE